MKTDDNNLCKSLFLLINLQEDALTDLISPRNNFVGSLLLVALLDSKLAAAGQLVKSTNFAGPLNHSSYIVNVGDMRESAKLVYALLEKAGLNHCARLYQFDPSELIFRNIFPAAGQDILFEDFKSLAETFGALSTAMADEMWKFPAAKKLPPVAGNK